MARPLRIAFEGAFYHVTARGNEGKNIFLSHKDYEKFLSYLTDAIHKFGMVLHAFVLMTNHYHLIVESPKGNLSRFMHTLNSAYTTYFNIKRRRWGHLFQGRYKAFVVDKDHYLLDLSRYIHLNPVRAGMAERPEDYPYSSLRCYLFPKEETLVFRDLIWDMISGERSKAPQRYGQFVASALLEKPANPFEKVYGGAILGGKAFIKEVLQRLNDQSLWSRETSQRRALASTTSEIDEIVDLLSIHFKVPKEKVLISSPYRGYAVYLARKHTPFSNAEIGAYFGGITYSAVTKIGTRLKMRMREDLQLERAIKNLEERLSRVKD
jgi:REP element-mobilizing transposase RayT